MAKAVAKSYLAADQVRKCYRMLHTSPRLAWINTSVLSLPTRMLTWRPCVIRFNSERESCGKTDTIC